MTRSVPLGPVRHVIPRLGRSIALTIVAGTLLAILGPFGSYTNGDPLRLLAYWVGSMLLGLLLYGSAYRVLGIRTAPGSPGWWLGLIVATLLASVPEALATRAAAFWLWPELARFHLLLPLWFAQTATIGAITMTGISLILRRPTAPPSNMPAPPSSVQPTVTTVAGNVLALQMEDHYVRVHRPAGTELIPMPLGRAIESHAGGRATNTSILVGCQPRSRSRGRQRSFYAPSPVERRGRAGGPLRRHPSEDSRLDPRHRREQGFFCLVMIAVLQR